MREDEARSRSGQHLPEHPEAGERVPDHQEHERQLGECGPAGCAMNWERDSVGLEDRHNVPPDDQRHLQVPHELARDAFPGLLDIGDPFMPEGVEDGRVRELARVDQVEEVVGDEVDGARSG